MKTPPTYAIASVDHALRLATMLQLEGSLRVAEAAERLGVAQSTAHRLLQMLVYRDFAVQDETRVYRAGPVLELAAHSLSRTALLRSVALPHMRGLVDAVEESSNLTIRTGVRARFIASVECTQILRVGSREGMVFPAHRTTGGLLLLAELSLAELTAAYSDSVGEQADRPELAELHVELAHIRKQGFAVNQGRSERGLVAVGVPVRDVEGTAIAGLSLSMPSVRYDRDRLPALVATLSRAAGAIQAGLTLAHR
ncbi:helix-turn-helix domain-containing protein [Streptomyces sp. SID8382]|uniref:IclR family transcriptional regulator n=1 Tax=Streptomyces malaysiensis TaxID=92644 RepID=UPI000C2CDE36|nr:MULTISPECIES: IclR family transcriptional regulator [unclassified Streptomyces]AUA16818.1 Pectin degradation repressor protein KdgR [Streptomyces sp. M56]MYX58049.1 helix-turn-helix domain-containing protein [Streptomyces sp. SID8382]